MLTRPKTYDRAIVSAVESGEYGKLEFRDKTIIDIGAHIGAFSRLAAAEGARKVIACEPEPENARLLRQNVASFASVEVREVAVWRSDVPAQSLVWTASDNPANTGGGSVFESRSNRKITVRAVPFDPIVTELGEVGLLKIDCEGSEYPILMTSSSLHLVNEIVGEWHRIPQHLNGVARDNWNPDGLLAWLHQNGFSTHSEVNVASRGRLGLFHAWR